MFEQLGTRVKWAAVKPWLGVTGLLGVGMLPCPDCGAPMILHFWPLAIGMSLYALRRRRTEPEAPAQAATEQGEEESKELK